MAYGISSFGVWDLIPQPGIDPSPQHRERGILATEPPGKSPDHLAGSGTPQALSPLGLPTGCSSAGNCLLHPCVWPTPALLSVQLRSELSLTSLTREQQKRTPPPCPYNPFHAPPLITKTRHSRHCIFWASPACRHS